MMMIMMIIQYIVLKTFDQDWFPVNIKILYYNVFNAYKLLYIISYSYTSIWLLLFFWRIVFCVTTHSYRVRN